ncbi:hypothetical protein V490_08891 [Pseudogymnoascus sp. VKM F-3557]|nr:hypothetical protein V490_08891 [Pseudogymnoascus sp. VKM F-3557]
MNFLKDTRISQVQPIPGLFISDRVAARSASLLRSLNIGYILSVTRTEDVPKFTSAQLADSEPPDIKYEFVQRHIDIQDDPTEDILIHLKDACDWIKAGLDSGQQKAKGDDQTQVGVLVHCTQGISRSGSIVIAYLMRDLSLDYATALSLAKESRPLIAPNQGFEAQLNVWGQCKYDIFIHDPGSAIPREKYAYKELKSIRDGLIGRGEEAVNRVRVASMASMAASFGKRRLQSIEDAKGKKDEEGEDEKQSAKPMSR